MVPFLDLTDGMSHEYFADGMTEEVIDKLSKEPGLRVAAPTTSFYLKRKPIAIVDIAKQLGVAYVLDGSVRKSHDTTYRVAARLSRGDNGLVVWSETYDRPSGDMLVDSGRHRDSGHEGDHPNRRTLNAIGSPIENMCTPIPKSTSLSSYGPVACERRERQHDVAHAELDDHAVEQAADDPMLRHECQPAARRIVGSGPGRGDAIVEHEAEHVEEGERAGALRRLPDQRRCDPEGYAPAEENDRLGDINCSGDQATGPDRHDCSLFHPGTLAGTSREVLNFA